MEDLGASVRQIIYSVWRLLLGGGQPVHHELGVPDSLAAACDHLVIQVGLDARLHGLLIVFIFPEVGHKRYVRCAQCPSSTI